MIKVKIKLVDDSSLMKKFDKNTNLWNVLKYFEETYKISLCQVKSDKDKFLSLPVLKIGNKEIKNIENILNTKISDLEIIDNKIKIFIKFKKSKITVN